MKTYKHCYVCFAGSVMAYSMNISSIRSLTNSKKNKMYALNDIRLGFIKSALRCMGVVTSTMPDDIRVTPYEDVDHAYQR